VRGRPAVYSRMFYVELAALYLDIESSRTTGRSSRKQVSKTLGLPETTIAKMIQRCRAMGLLPPTVSGKRMARKHCPTCGQPLPHHPKPPPGR
jgi:DNA-binding transcriptional regulator LsrR (DeoR family)